MAIMRTVMLALVMSVAVVIGNASMSMAGSKASLLYDPKSPVPDSGKEVLKSQFEFMAVELFSLAVAEVVDVSVEGSM